MLHSGRPEVEGSIHFLEHSAGRVATPRHTPEMSCSLSCFIVEKRLPHLAFTLPDLSTESNSLDDRRLGRHAISSGVYPDCDCPLDDNSSPSHRVHSALCNNELVMNHIEYYCLDMFMKKINVKYL
ncbi:hypothetical protein B5X24_HaOG203075 [Helicoverpa armigera]|uniref:Uncharacterized protein n=1 Tax=Helicoverpa armigera TaxID=29058 RepID=A0A2W1BRP4_HELAM|nr:hypothetical protein B5X24_HaOG203075 [Helicoverpa armigera]